MPVRTQSETRKCLYRGGGGEVEVILFCGVCHLSEQKCISTKIGMGAGLAIEKGDRQW